jgi:hypothetical protein
MRVQRFSAVITAGPRGSGVVVVPFDPDEVWGAKAAHPVGGTIDGSRFRGTVSPGGATTRRPDLRAARIAEVVELLAAGVKERPRSLGKKQGRYSLSRS